jgi:pimeloyl-ACP methyl ester carboxylesterase
MEFTSDDAQLYYEFMGAGPSIVLLHPFPVHHGFWKSITGQLATRYQVVLPDLRAHGRSEVGKGTATMAKHASDLMRLLEALQIPKAVFVGVSLGGYLLFEFWRKFRERTSALVLANTRAEADTEQGRANRLKSIADSRLHGTGPFFDAQAQNLIGETTRRTRPDIVANARAMMQMMSVDGLAAIQQGMAERPDSVPTLRTINVPTLIIAGEEDTVTPIANAKLMHQQIDGSQLQTIARGGHYSALEDPQEFGRALRQFLDQLRLG